MSAVFQVDQVPILVDQDPQGSDNIPYDEAWMRSVDGQTLIDMHFPLRVPANAECFLTRRTRGAKCFDDFNARQLDAIPRKEDIDNAYALIRGVINDRPNDIKRGWVSMKDFGLVSEAGIRVFQRIYRVMDFTRELKVMLDWMDQESWFTG
ncbi:hypothetical protein BGX31_004000, partial [Mortierella sp. GBA43]